MLNTKPNVLTTAIKTQCVEDKKKKRTFDEKVRLATEIINIIHPNLLRDSAREHAKREKIEKAKKSFLADDKGKSIGFAKTIGLEFLNPLAINELNGSAHIKKLIAAHEEDRNSRGVSNREGTRIIYIENGVPYTTTDLLRDIGVDDELMQFIDFRETERRIFTNFIDWQTLYQERLASQTNYGIKPVNTHLEFAKEVIGVFENICDAEQIYEYTDDNLSTLKNGFTSIGYEAKAVSIDTVKNTVDITCKDDERYIEAGVIEQITNSMPLVNPYYAHTNQVNYFSTEMFKDIVPHDFRAYILNKTLTGTGGTTEFFRRTIKDKNYRCIIAIPTTTPMSDKMKEYFDKTDRFCFVASGIEVQKKDKILKSTTDKCDIAKALRDGKTIVTTYDSLGIIIDIVKNKQHEFIYGRQHNRCIERVDFDENVLGTYEIIYDEVHIAIEYAQTFKPEVINSIYYHSHRFKTAIYMTATVPNFAGTPLELLPMVNFHWNDDIRPVLEYIDVSEDEYNQIQLPFAKKKYEKIVGYIARQVMVRYDKKSSILIFSNSHTDNIHIIRMLIASGIVTPNNIFVRCSTNDNTKRKYYREGVELLSDHKQENFDYAGKVVIHTSVAFQGSDIHLSKKVSGNVSVFINNDHNSIGTTLSKNTIEQICGRVRSLYRNGVKMSSHDYFLNNDDSYKIYVAYSSPREDKIEKQISRMNIVNSTILEIYDELQLKGNVMYDYAQKIINENNNEPINSQQISEIFLSQEKTNGYRYNALVTPLVEGYYIKNDGKKVFIEISPYIVCGKSLMLNSLGLLSYIESIQVLLPDELKYRGGCMIDYIRSLGNITPPPTDKLRDDYIDDGVSIMYSVEELLDFLDMDFGDKFANSGSDTENSMEIPSDVLPIYAIAISSCDMRTIKKLVSSKMRYAQIKQEKLEVAKLELNELVKRYNAIDDAITVNELDADDISVYSSSKMQEYRNVLHAIQTIDYTTKKTPINEYNFTFVREKFKNMIGVLGNVIEMGKLNVNTFKVAFRQSFDNCAESVKNYLGYYKSISKSTLEKFFVLGDVTGRNGDRTYEIMGIKPMFQLAYNEFANKNGYRSLDDNIIDDVAKFVSCYNHTEYYQDDGYLIGKSFA